MLQLHSTSTETTHLRISAAGYLKDNHNIYHRPRLINKQIYTIRLAHVKGKQFVCAHTRPQAGSQSRKK